MKRKIKTKQIKILVNKWVEKLTTASRDISLQGEPHRQLGMVSDRYSSERIETVPSYCHSQSLTA